jgi:hypothetical protein
MIQIQKMPRKQAILHSGRLDSSKNCAGRDFKRDPSTGLEGPGRVPKIELDDYAMSDMRR